MIQFPKQDPTDSVLNIRHITFYGCSKITRTRIYRVCYSFGQFTAAFHFSNYIREIDHFTLDLLKRSNAGLSEKFLIVDHSKENHNEREFNRQIIGGILDLLKKKKHLYKWSTNECNSFNTRASKKLFEVIVAPKCGPLARIEIQAMSYKLTLQKSFSKIRKAPV